MPEERIPRTPAPISLGGGWTFILAAAAIAAFGVAGWAIVVQKAPLTDRMVLVSLLAGVWFAARVAIKLLLRRP